VPRAERAIEAGDSEETIAFIPEAVEEDLRNRLRRV